MPNGYTKLEVNGSSVLTTVMATGLPFPSRVGSSPAKTESCSFDNLITLQESTRYIHVITVLKYIFTIFN